MRSNPTAQSLTRCLLAPRPFARTQLPRAAVPTLLTLVLLAAAGCTSDDTGESGGTDDTSGDGCTGATPCDAAVEIGQGYTAFAALGGSEAPWQLVLGGQGLYMLPMTLRLSGFDMPPDPGDWSDPNLPQLAVTMDVPGHPGAISGHFVRIANYPLASVDLGDGRYEVVYIPLIIPDADAMAPMELDDAPGTVQVEVRAADGERIVESLDVILLADPIEEQPPSG
jgi:hypothetical protein